MFGVNTKRYKRQVVLPEVGELGQQKLSEAAVLVVGAGGLGCPVLQYLAAAGTGRLGIVDFDRVELENLHRQVLYGDKDVGRMKAVAAGEKIEQLNPFVKVDIFTEKLNRANTLHFRSSMIEITKKNTYVVDELIDYEAFCGLNVDPIPEISYDEYKEWVKNGENVQLVDVRQPEEHEDKNIGGLLMPLSNIEELTGRLNREKAIVLYCETGQRSKIAAQKLTREY